MLPKPKDPLGYTKQEILAICRKRKINPQIFWGLFGVNTVAVGKDGKPRFYRCDVEKALYTLGDKDGSWHMWD